MQKKDNLKTLDAFIDDNYGKKGTANRDEFEQGYDEFKLGVMIQEARLEKGLTQEQLAEKTGVSARYVQSLEAGEYFPSLPKLVKLKLALRCGWAEIFDGCEKICLSFGPAGICGSSSGWSSPGRCAWLCVVTMTTLRHG